MRGLLPGNKFQMRIGLGVRILRNNKPEQLLNHFLHYALFCIIFCDQNIFKLLKKLKLVSAARTTKSMLPATDRGTDNHHPMSVQVTSDGLRVLEREGQNRSS